jgi:hypothetical protein
VKSGKGKETVTETGRMRYEIGRSRERGRELESRESDRESWKDVRK